MQKIHPRCLTGFWIHLWKQNWVTKTLKKGWTKNFQNKFEEIDAGTALLSSFLAIFYLGNCKTILHCNLHLGHKHLTNQHCQCFCRSTSKKIINEQMYHNVLQGAKFFLIFVFTPLLQSLIALKESNKMANKFSQGISLVLTRLTKKLVQTKSVVKVIKQMETRCCATT